MPGALPRRYMSTVIGAAEEKMPGALPRRYMPTMIGAEEEKMPGALPRRYISYSGSPFRNGPRSSIAATTANTIKESQPPYW